MYRDGTIRKYLDDAAAGIPAPGGGSVSALAGALATAMGSMTANFTVGKKKFLDVEPQAKDILRRLDGLRERLLVLMDEDVKAYGVVLAAYGMPKETPEEKAARGESVQKALITAMDAPLKIVRACAEALEAVAALVDVANPNLISDVGVSAILAEAALRAAKLNVDANLAGIKDAELVKRTAAEMEQAESRAVRILCDVMTKVRAKVKS